MQVCCCCCCFDKNMLVYTRNVNSKQTKWMRRIKPKSLEMWHENDPYTVLLKNSDISYPKVVYDNEYLDHSTPISDYKHCETNNDRNTVRQFTKNSSNLENNKNERS